MDQALLTSDDLPGIGLVREAAIRCADSLPTGRASDARLIRACAKFGALERRCLALYFGPQRIEDDGARDRMLAPIKARMDRVLQDICDQRAVTLEGHRARAAAVALYAPDLITEKDLGGYTDQSIVGALLRDLVGEEAV